MDCPANSPDDNQIEHAWDALRRRVAASLPPRTLHELPNCAQGGMEYYSPRIIEPLNPAHAPRCHTFRGL